MSDSNIQEPHIGCNACPEGVDLTLTDPATGSIKMVQWSWADVRAFIMAHGDDMTHEVTGLLQDHLPE